MYRPTKIQLNQNLIEILKIESTVRVVKNLSIEGKVPLKCYHSLKSASSKLLNDLYIQRSSLLVSYKQDMKKFLDWEWRQIKENHIQNQKDFDNMIDNMTDDERKLLRKFRHKL